MAHKKMVSQCPVCSGEMAINRLRCGTCETQIETELPIPPFFRLPVDLQEFVMAFLRCRGNIREVEKELGISYPTVCKRLDLANELLGNQRKTMDRKQVLERLEKGEISAEEATQLLKGR